MSEQSETNWAVLTGSGSSGKSALTNYFASDGQQIIPEGSGQYAELAKSKGETNPESYGNQSGEIANYNRQMEAQRDAEEPILLDRSLGDSLAFMDFYLEEGPPEELMEEARNKYDQIFYLEQPAPDMEEIWDPNTDTSEELGHHLKDFYEEELGYEVIEVPVADIEERARIVAENSELEEPEFDLKFPSEDQVEMPAD